jgi:hypothetical protein
MSNRKRRALKKYHFSWLIFIFLLIKKIVANYLENSFATIPQLITDFVD